MKKNEVKLLALIGGSMVALFGALAVAVVEEQAIPGSVASSGVQTGSTVTQSQPPTAPQTPVATPRIKGPAPLPPEEQGLPG
jgi:hypothetical protein